MVPQEITERTPTDPLEAELLAMAEAVSAGPKPGDSDTDEDMDEGFHAGKVLQICN